MFVHGIPIHYMLYLRFMRPFCNHLFVSLHFLPSGGLNLLWNLLFPCLTSCTRTSRLLDLCLLHFRCRERNDLLHQLLLQRCRISSSYYQRFSSLPNLIWKSTHHSLSHPPISPSTHSEELIPNHSNSHFHPFHPSIQQLGIREHIRNWQAG